MSLFQDEVKERIRANGQNNKLKALSAEFMKESTAPKYSYNFSWLGRPVIQYPQDIIAMQELIWMLKPDLIIETGIAHGGSLILYSSLLELNAQCGGPDDAHIVGVDIDIRNHNRQAIENHPMYKRISLIEGSSTDETIIKNIGEIAKNKKTVMVCLDSNHTHEHVLLELNAYAPLTSIGSYCVVFDTVIEDLDEDMFPERPWQVGNNPKTAVKEFLQSHDEFSIDECIDNKLLISVANNGYLKRIA